MDVTVDFLDSASLLFNDGVNVVDGQWAPLGGEAVRLTVVGSSATGYVGHDPARLAAIRAVQQVTSPAGADGQPTSDITVARIGATLTLTGTGVR